TGFSAAGHAAHASRAGSRGGVAQPPIAAATSAAIAIDDNERAASCRGEEAIGLGPAGSGGRARDRGRDRVVDVSEEAEIRRRAARASGGGSLRRLNAGRAGRST